MASFTPLLLLFLASGAATAPEGSEKSPAPASVNTLSVLSAERRTVWQPGVAGGIPKRTRVCATL